MYNTIHKFKLAHFLGRNLVTERFLPFKLLYGIFKKVNFSKKVIRNGASFTLLIKNGTGIMNWVSEYEEWLDKLLPKLINKENAVFIDIGANTGQTMLKVLPHFPDVRYLAIEPNAHCVSYLKSLSEVNNFKNVKIFECGLSDAKGESELLTRYQDDILATTTHSFRKFTKYAIKKKVEMMTGDALIKAENLTDISVIKLDIEGGEASAIEGLLDTIRKFQPYIICEIAPLPTEDSGVTLFRTMSANRILSMLHDLNYSAINIVTGNTIHRAEDLSVSIESCNYLFLPKMKVAVMNLN